MFGDESYSRQNDAESDIVVLVSLPIGTMCIFPSRLYKPSYDYAHYDYYDYNYNATIISFRDSRYDNRCYFIRNMPVYMSILRSEL